LRHACPSITLIRFKYESLWIDIVTATSFRHSLIGLSGVNFAMSVDVGEDREPLVKARILSTGIDSEARRGCTWIQLPWRFPTALIRPR